MNKWPTFSFISEDLLLICQHTYIFHYYNNPSCVEQIFSPSFLLLYFNNNKLFSFLVMKKCIAFKNSFYSDFIMQMPCLCIPQHVAAHSFCVTSHPYDASTHPAQALCFSHTHHLSFFLSPFNHGLSQAVLSLCFPYASIDLTWPGHA